MPVFTDGWLTGRQPYRNGFFFMKLLIVDDHGPLKT